MLFGIFYHNSEHGECKLELSRFISIPIELNACSIAYNVRLISHQVASAHTQVHAHAKWCALNRYIMMHNWAKDSCDASTLRSLNARLLHSMLTPLETCKLPNSSIDHRISSICAGHNCVGCIFNRRSAHVFDCDLPYSTVPYLEHAIQLFLLDF